LVSPLAATRKKFREWNLPIRVNSKLEPIPVCIITRLEPNADIQGLSERIRVQGLVSLLNFKDICVYPSQCRFFSLEVDRAPYFSKTPTREEIRLFHSRFPHKLYITKECALRVKGFRGIRRNCPFKSEGALEVIEKTRSRYRVSRTQDSRAQDRR
jgi:hypothetical protein